MTKQQYTTVIILLLLIIAGIAVIIFQLSDISDRTETIENNLKAYFQTI